MVQLRPVKVGDLPAIFDIRTSVRENALTMEELAERGITPNSFGARLEEQALQAWCAEVEDQLVGFSVVDSAAREVFALFVRPEAEGRGVGGALLDVAVDWLFQRGPKPIRLVTGPDTRAYVFYTKRGWRYVSLAPHGDVWMELAARPGA